MSILQLLKGLAGKQDISWGDSSTTFDRKTQVGGTITVNKVDAEAIPSTKLLGYIGDHLHKQNTDSLTTSSTFGLNSGGNSLVLDGSKLSTSRTFTFPDTQVSQALVGATDLVTAGDVTKGATLVGIADPANLTGTSNVETCLTEIMTNINTLEDATHNFGLKLGFKLAYIDTTNISISGGMWAHTGTDNQHVYLTAQTTFELGPAGSNALSSTLSTDELHYIYIDDDAVVVLGSPALTAEEFRNATVVDLGTPTYDHAKNGFYFGNHRCIGAVLTNASSEICNFAVFGKQYYQYAIPIDEYGTSAAYTTYTVLDISDAIPTFATMARLRIQCATAGTTFCFNTSNTAVSPEVQTISTNNGVITTDVPLDSSQTLYWYGGGPNDTDIDVVGYYLDEL